MEMISLTTAYFTWIAGGIQLVLNSIRLYSEYFHGKERTLLAFANVFFVGGLSGMIFASSYDSSLYISSQTEFIRIKLFCFVGILYFVTSTFVTMQLFFSDVLDFFEEKTKQIKLFLGGKK